MEQATIHGKTQHPRLVLMARLLVDEGYIRAVNSNPSERLIAKLKKLGWKPGQLIYSDWAKKELKFFNNRKDLKKFIDSRKNLYQRPIKPEATWDTLADIELQFDKLDGLQ